MWNLGIRITYVSIYIVAQSFQASYKPPTHSPVAANLSHISFVGKHGGQLLMYVAHEYNYHQNSMRNLGMLMCQYILWHKAFKKSDHLY